MGKKEQQDEEEERKGALLLPTWQNYFRDELSDDQAKSSQ